eukprot:scaffold1727_cov133-Cylindrotheca_fusiformis.AAC.32
MKSISGVAIVLGVAVVCWVDNRLDQWELDAETYQKGLLRDAQVFNPTQSWDDLPACVQRYLDRVAPVQNSVRSLWLQQQGEFLIKKDTYVPFSGKELISANPPGFSWEGEIDMTASSPSWFPKLRVSESFVDGLGHFKSAILAIFPEIHTDQDGSIPMVTMGQAMRWLADAVLIPTVLKPEAGVVTWKGIDGAPDKAILEFSNVPLPGIELEASFDSEGWMTQLVGKKPIMNHDNQFVMRHWQADLSAYVEQEYGMYVPRHVNSGWINDKGEFEIYYKTENVALHYHSNAEPLRSS